MHVSLRTVSQNTLLYTGRILPHSECEGNLPNLESQHSNIYMYIVFPKAKECLQFLVLCRTNQALSGSLDVMLEQFHSRGASLIHLT